MRVLSNMQTFPCCIIISFKLIWYGDNMMKWISFISLFAWVAHIKRIFPPSPWIHLEWAWTELPGLSPEPVCPCHTEQWAGWPHFPVEAVPKQHLSQGQQSWALPYWAAALPWHAAVRGQEILLATGAPPHWLSELLTSETNDNLFLNEKLCV